MRLTRALEIIALGLALTACDRAKQRDCNATARTMYLMGDAHEKTPKKPAEVPEIAKVIDDGLAAWERTKGGVTTPEVKSAAEAFAGVLQARRKLLDHAFDPPAASATAPTAPTAAPAASADTPEARRKAALAAAAGAAVKGMLGDQPTNSAALFDNAREGSATRGRFFDACPKLDL